jgi:prepilin-type N-terminal cleavage/methylation domain-containing protein
MTTAQTFKKTTKRFTLRASKGFTLIELLVVIGILAVLLAITLIAINPARQFSQANDTKRASDVNAILNAVGQYAADNKGALPGGIPTGTAAEIGDGTGQVDLCDALVPTYMAALPTDPLGPTNGAPITSCAANYETDYTIVRSGTDNRLTVSATSEITPATPISVTR